jgi:hypothetical protein
MNPIIIPNTLPDTIIALSGETLAEIAAIQADAAAIVDIPDVPAMEAADAVVVRAIKIDKAIEAERKRLKAPILSLVEDLDNASGEARAPLIGIKSDLGRKILAFQAAENVRREAERRRIEEERRAAEAARQKALAEARAAEAARAKAESDRLAEIGRLEDEAASKGETLAPWEEPAPVAASEPVHIPEVLPRYEEQAAVAPLKSRAVVQKTLKVVTITDPSLVPREFGGVALWIIDSKAVEKLAKAGATIPGVSITEQVITAAKG